MPRKLFSVTIATLALALIVVPLIIAQNGKPVNFRAELNGKNEVPPVATEGAGRFQGTVNSDDTEIAWQLEFSGLSGPASQAHIHFGHRDSTGGIVYWICGSASNPGPAGTPSCPAVGSGNLTGFVRAATIAALPAQGVFGGDFAKVLDAVRGGRAYVNIHTSQSPGGEIRGQLRPGRGDDDDDDGNGKGGDKGKRKGQN